MSGHGDRQSERRRTIRADDGTEKDVNVERDQPGTKGNREREREHARADDDQQLLSTWEEPSGIAVCQHCLNAYSVPVQHATLQNSFVRAFLMPTILGSMM